MSYKAEIYNVMLASPSDVSEERRITCDIISEWNIINAATRRIVLLPLSWEYNSFPTMGNRPQAIINEKILKNADILVGIFWTRIGTPTGKAISGTVEEIEEHIESGKQTMLYFSTKPIIPDKIDQEQYRAVTDLKKEFQKRGLTTDFESDEDFKEKFQRHLSMLLNDSQHTTIISENIVDGNKSKMFNIENNLSDDAKRLLIEVSNDPNGKIMKLSLTAGAIFITNGIQLNEDDSPRTKARWEAAIEELLTYNLISNVNNKGTFEMTNNGYKMTEEICTKEKNN